MKKFLLYIMVLAGMMSMQSCLHDDKELFGESAADRLDHATEETRQILESSESGWALQYYLGDEYTGGGCTYLVKFKNGKADVSLDIADPSEVTHSSYDVIKDQGPVLTFNTYNALMHYFANPTTDGTTDGGDFEFVIMNVTNDEIDLKGRTTGNKMKLVRLPEGTDWATYINSISEFEQNMFSSYKLITDGKTEGVVTFDMDERRFSYISSDSTVSITSPFCVTPNGVVMPKALTEGAYSYAQKDGGLNLTASEVADGKSVYLEPFFTPDYVLRGVGSSLAMNDDAQTKTVKLNQANIFTYTSDADWLTVSADENGLTINATANNEGHPRVATIKVTNENGEDEFTVSQMEYAKDIVGSYALAFYDANGNFAALPFEVEANSPEAIDIPITIGSYTLHATLSWNAETASFDWTSGQYMGMWRTYYIFNLFVGDQYWSAASTDIVYSAPVSYDVENGQTYADFSVGQVAGEDITSVYLEACTSNPANSNSFAGYVNMMQAPAIIKLSDTSGARGAAAKSIKQYNLLKKYTPAPAALQANPKFGKKLIK